jgi:hypothetical protein
MWLETMNKHGLTPGHALIGSVVYAKSSFSPIAACREPCHKFRLALASPPESSE